MIHISIQFSSLLKYLHYCSTKLGETTIFIYDKIYLYYSFEDYVVGSLHSMKIGNYSVPNYRLDFLIVETKEIYDNFKKERFSKRDIAEILKHDIKSGTLAQKIADLRSYRLIEGRVDENSVSELGFKIVYGVDETERNAAIEQAVRNIKLWDKLLAKYGTSIKEENFEIVLRRDTEADPIDAKKKAKFIRNAYLEDVKLIKNVGEPKKPPQDLESGDIKTRDRIWNMEIEGKNLDEPSGYIWYPKYGRAPTEIRDDLSYAIAEKVLEAIKVDLERKKKEKAMKGNEYENSESQESENVDIKEIQ